MTPLRMPCPADLDAAPQLSTVAVADVTLIALVLALQTAHPQLRNWDSARAQTPIGEVRLADRINCLAARLRRLLDDYTLAIDLIAEDERSLDDRF